MASFAPAAASGLPLRPFPFLRRRGSHSHGDGERCSAAAFWHFCPRRQPPARRCLSGRPPAGRPPPGLWPENPLPDAAARGPAAGAGALTQTHRARLFFSCRKGRSGPPLCGMRQIPFFPPPKKAARLPPPRKKTPAGTKPAGGVFFHMRVTGRSAPGEKLSLSVTYTKYLTGRSAPRGKGAHRAGGTRTVPAAPGGRHAQVSRRRSSPRAAPRGGPARSPARRGSSPSRPGPLDRVLWSGR